MSFDYANTDPNRRRMRFGSRLMPLVIGLAVVAFGALAARKYASLNRSDSPPQSAAPKPTAPQPTPSLTPTPTKP